MIQRIENSEQLCVVVRLAAHGEWVASYLLKTPEAATLLSPRLTNKLRKVAARIDDAMDDPEDSNDEDFDQTALELLARNFDKYPVYMELIGVRNDVHKRLFIWFWTESDVVWNEEQVRDIVKEADRWA